jgi:hypothetical protein
MDPKQNFENFSDIELVEFDKFTFTEKKFKELLKPRKK